MRRAIISLLLVAAPCAVLAQAAAPPTRIDTAKLTFKWPETIRARVDARRYRERDISGKRDTSDVRMSYRMTAARTGEEYVIRFDDFRLGGTNAIAQTPAIAAFAERLGGFVPSYRVSAAGEFARLESPVTIRAFLDSMLTALTSKDGPPPPQLKELMTTMTSDAMLEAKAAEEWNALVGTWIGGELEVGEVYGTEGEEPIPVFQNAVIKFEYEFSAVRRLPCDSIARPTARDCIELEMMSRPDSAAMRQLVQRVLGAIVADSAGGAAFTDFNVENVVTLVARPESLLPVHLTVSKEVTGAVREKGTTEKLHQIEVQTRKYSYH
jgi:hypothetical protein